MQNYYRKIHALFPKKYKKYFKAAIVAYHLRNFLLVSLAAIALLQIQVLVDLNTSFRGIIDEKESRAKDYEYWGSVAGQFPNIPDVLYNTALSAFNVGKPDEALRFVEQALRVDPLFEEALKLKDEIIKG